MPTVYERVEHGEVAERVQPVPGDYEDTRLGLDVLKAQEQADRGELGTTPFWRIAGQELTNAVPAESTNTPAEDAGRDTPKPAKPAPSKEK